MEHEKNYKHKNSPRRPGGNFLLTLKTTNMKLAEIRIYTFEH